jgi:carboxypeptidase Q
MMTKALNLLWLWGLTASGAGLPPAVRSAAERIRQAALSGSGAAGIVQSLCDHVGPRLAGSAGSRAAVAWALEQMRGLGLENVRAEKMREPRWERGVETAEIVAPAMQPLAVTALGGSPATSPEGLEADVVSTENVESLHALLARDPSAVRDRIVFYSEKMTRQSDGSGYGKTVNIRWAGPTEAARAGAAAVLIRTVGTSSNRLPHTGVMKTGPEIPLVPAAALSAPDADLLERLVREGKTIRVRLILTCRTLPDVAGSNVIGELSGSERPREIVLLGAHLDSWDLGTGALDDAAGVGVVLETARILSRLPKRPKRTLRVVLFANEENGGRGAAAYRDAHRPEMSEHVAALEMDLGADRVRAFSWLAGGTSEPALSEVAALLSPLEITAKKPEASGGADIGGLREFGVPLLDLSQDASRYFDFHHSADDTFDKIDPKQLDQAVAAAATVAYCIADMPERPAPIPEEKRKAQE